MSNNSGVSFQPVPPAMQRLGVAVRNRGDDGVHTYRIPGLATTNKGTLIGVYDVRRRSGGDLPGDIDVGMSRSTDGGRTWDAMKVVMDMGDNPKWHYDGIGDPAVLVDKTTGTIWVAGTWSHGNRSWRGSGPGMKPEETGQLMLVRSDDDGVTWSKPINITSQVKRPEWCFVLQGPGKGITMRDGTIVFAAQYQDTPENKRLPRSTIIYSSDHGKTWQAGGGVLNHKGAYDDTTESQVVEYEPGRLMLNCRYNRKSTRVVMTTSDFGRTWSEHPTSQRSLIEPRACMASLINADQEVGQDIGGWLLFSNPDSTAARERLMIKASNDVGMTWPKQHRLLLDEGRSAGYSCLSMIDEKTVGILYEGSQAHMTFQRIPLSDVIGKPSQAGSLRHSKPAEDKTSHRDKTKNDRTQTVPPPRSQLALPAVFADHMVLQADAKIPIWGRAPPRAKVSVDLGGVKQTTAADCFGDWKLHLPARRASSTPVRLSVESGKKRIEFKDVLIGEVWVCAGQSNMEWPLAQSTNGAEELARLSRGERGSSAAKQTGSIRLLHLKGVRGGVGPYTPEMLDRLTPDAFCQGKWEVASVESARDFSAVGWYFAIQLQQELDVPVGLICPAVGGTPTEAWIPRQTLQDSHVSDSLRRLAYGDWLRNPLVGDFCRTRGIQNLYGPIQDGERFHEDELGPNHPFKPGFMWEAGIEPLIPYGMRGVIWYQGESNAETSAQVSQHEEMMLLLIKQWRRRWGQSDFPFLYVQLPGLNRPHWPLFRERQRRVLTHAKNVGMAVTIDTGHPTNVHPPLKKPVGERLAKLALGKTYGSTSHTAFSGPVLDDSRRDGETLVVTFTHAGDGLKSSDGKPLRHFVIRDDDGVFHPAAARIIGKNKIALSSPHVTNPNHARYAWLPFPDPPVNLVNSEGLPASPFSTLRFDPESGRTLNDTVSDQAARRPNILLIVGEDHGCELSCYGDPVINTPNIDRLASQGVLFENGYVTQSVCSPSRSSIFTGLYPHQNGQLGLATHQYGWFKRWPTSYSFMKKAGYRTGLIGKTHVNPAAAVEDYVDFRFQESSNFAKRNVADYAVKAGEFFRAGDKPFFMTVNYPDAHWPLQGQVDGLPVTRVDPKRVKVMPYVGGETPRMREVVRNYYDCMLRLDACVGQLLKQLDKSDKADNTLVVFIGDHGAQMARGKVTVYEGGLRVPFIVRWPGELKPGQRSKALVSTIDLLPTFMDAATVYGMDDAYPEIAAPRGLRGKWLHNLLDEPELQREYLVCERNCDAARHTFPQRTIRDARYKLIYSPVRDREDPAARYYREHGATHWSGCLTDEELNGASARTKAAYARWLNPPEFQLYDLQADPHEWVDLGNDPKHADTKARLLAELQKWQKETNDPIADPEKLRQLMAENDAVAKSGRRSPFGGWKYLDYLSPH